MTTPDIIHALQRVQAETDLLSCSGCARRSNRCQLEGCAIANKFLSLLSENAKTEPGAHPAAFLYVHKHPCESSTLARKVRLL